MKKILAFIGLLGVIYALAWQLGMFSAGADGVLGAPGRAVPTAERRVEPATPPGPNRHNLTAPGACDGSALTNAYRNHQRRIDVCGHGVVVRVLQDDLRGSAHQRFVVRLPSGQTVLIAHNTDIAPRIVALRPGAPLEFAGEYEWNVQGGVVHWTHRDPAGRHPAGWIRYADRVYQ